MQTQESTSRANNNLKTAKAKRPFEAEDHRPENQKRREFGGITNDGLPKTKMGIGKSLHNQEPMKIKEESIKKGGKLAAGLPNTSTTSSVSTTGTLKMPPVPVVQMFTTSVNTQEGESHQKDRPATRNLMEKVVLPLHTQMESTLSRATPPRSFNASYWLSKQPAMSPSNRFNIASYGVSLSDRGFFTPVEFPLAESFELLDLVLNSLDAPVHPCQLQILYWSCVFLAVQEMKDEYPGFVELLAVVIETVEEMFTAVVFQEAIGTLKMMLKSLYPNQSIRQLAGHNAISVFTNAAPVVFSELDSRESKIYFQTGMMTLETLLFDLGVLRFGPTLTGISVALILKKSIPERKETFNLESELQRLGERVSEGSVIRCANYILNLMTQKSIPEVVLSKYRKFSRAFASMFQLIRLDATQSTSTRNKASRRTKSLPSTFIY